MRFVFHCSILPCERGGGAMVEFWILDVRLLASLGTIGRYRAGVNARSEMRKVDCGK